MPPSEYEAKALRGIHEWKDPSRSLFDRALDVVNWPANKTGGLIKKLPAADRVIEKTVGEMVRLLNEFAHWSVRREAIYREFRKSGRYIFAPADVFRLDLQDVDSVIGRLGLKYQGLATGEGAAGGIIGALGIPADVAALVTINLRAIGEYATYCGFDVTMQEERLFAMDILGLASSPDATARGAAFARLVSIAQAVARKRAWKQIEKHLFGRITDGMARSLGSSLAESKMAQFIPLAGSIVGGGFNAYFTGKVCKAASNLYRERFLAEKYGPGLIEVIGEPLADDYSFRPED